MDKETISKIGKILEELYPDYYSRAMEARELFLGRPKEGSLCETGSKFLQLSKTSCKHYENNIGVYVDLCFCNLTIWFFNS